MRRTLQAIYYDSGSGEIRAVLPDGAATEEVVYPQTGSGEANTSSNVGSGSGWAKAKSGVDLPFKTFIATSPLGITSNTNDLTLAITWPGSNGEVFFRASGDIAADAGLTYDSANDRLSVVGAIRVGSTPQNTTGIGLANNTGVFFRNAGNSANISALTVDGSNVLRLGDANSANVVISYEATAGFYNQDSSVYDLLINEDTDIQYRLPRHGLSTPYASEGVTRKTLSGASGTVSGADASRACIIFSGSPNDGCNVTFSSTAANDDAAFPKDLVNLCGVDINIFVGSGMGGGIEIAAGTACRVVIDDTDGPPIVIARS